MLDGTKKIFQDDYDDFVNAMCLAAEDDDLPVGLQYKGENLKDITLQDIHDLIYDFYNDTALELKATLFMCNECGQLHMLITINYSEDDEDTPIQ